MVTFNEDKQEKKLADLRQQEEEDRAQDLSQSFSIPYVDLSITAIDTDALRLIPEAQAREGSLAVFNMTGKKLDIALLSPQKESAIEIIQALKEHGHDIVLHIASRRSLEVAWDRYKDLSFATETKAGVLDISNEQISSFLGSVKTIADVQRLIEETLALKKSFRISRCFEITLAAALSLKASDVHIEPEEEYARLRFRLDGVLTDIFRFDNETFRLLLTRVKLLSGLKLNVEHEAQDGRFSIKVEESDIEIRTSVLPGAYNESIVLRILNPASISVPMENLGIEDKLLALINHEISKPNGMILTTGPTGSGKTTTLYAFVQKIHTPAVKIITIEDPIEYHLPGIVQTQTDNEKGYTFSSGLRAALRQDPDVIMVGEIRDSETAQIAVNSSLTGHLVFSTLHTNDAAGAFPRLIDLEVDQKVLTSAINVVIAQRLLRKLCPECKKEVTLEGDNKVLIERIVGGITNKEHLAEVQTEKMWTAAGCTACNGLGYKGRIGIFEAILVTEEIEKIVKENPSEREIKKVAEKQGILDMQQDGVLKILKGITSLEELERVIDLSAAR